MKKPKYINLFIDSSDELGMLSDAQAGRLVKALLRYASGGGEPDFADDTVLRVMFSVMKKQIDREFGKYEALCAKRSEAGKRGGAPLGNTNARKTTKTSKTSEDKDEDNDNDKDNNKDDLTCGAEGRAGSTLCLSEVGEVIDYLNEKTGAHFRATSVGTRALIAQLLEQGYTVADMKRVVDSKCAEWLDSEFSRYLRPDVLFGKKFECYLNAPKPRQSLPKSRLHPWQNDTQDSFMEAIRRFEEEYEVPGCQ